MGVSHTYHFGIKYMEICMNEYDQFNYGLQLDNAVLMIYDTTYYLPPI